MVNLFGARGYAAGSTVDSYLELIDKPVGENTQKDDGGGTRISNPLNAGPTSISWGSHP